MLSGAQAYGRVAKVAPRAPRELEAELLMKAAAQLHRARQNWPEVGGELDAALTFNRRLWTILATSATDPENPLPSGLKQNIADLGIFVLNRTMQMLSNPEPEKLDALVTINSELAAGLRTTGAAA